MVWSLGPTAYMLWSCILIRANWKDGWFQGRRIKRGQLAVSMGTLAKKCQCCRHTVIRTLKKFIDSGMIKTEEVSNQFTVITVCNYNRYQDSDIQGATTMLQPQLQPSYNQVATLATTELQPCSNPCYTNEEGKKDKKVRREEGKKEKIEVPSEPRPQRAREKTAQLKPGGVSPGKKEVARVKTTSPPEYKTGDDALDSLHEAVTMVYKATYPDSQCFTRGTKEGGLARGVLTQLLKAGYSADDLIDAMGAYLADPNPYYVKQHHPWLLFQTDIKKLMEKPSQGALVLAEVARSLLPEDARPSFSNGEGRLWALTIDTLLKRGTKPEEVEKALRWAATDSFWATHIPNATTLVTKFPTLMAKACAKPKRGASPVDHFDDSDYMGADTQASQALSLRKATGLTSSTPPSETIGTPKGAN